MRREKPSAEGELQRRVRRAEWCCAILIAEVMVLAVICILLTMRDIRIIGILESVTQSLDSVNEALGRWLDFIHERPVLR